MTAPFERFGLVINNRIVKTPIAIAPMSGIVDATYVLSRADHIGIGFIGGYSIDSKTIDASRKMAAAGRSEFLIDDPIEELDRQIKYMKGSDVLLGINLRGSSPDAFVVLPIHLVTLLSTRLMPTAAKIRWYLLEQASSTSNALLIS
jgi:NAD(P)H-dependent flavin oxidoreductase YrpB (nitropropane dioxygenase family)